MSSSEEEEFGGGEEEEEFEGGEGGEEESDDDDDDDVPLSSLKQGPSSGSKRKRAAVDYSGADGSDDDDDDDEDDVPLATLKRSSPSSKAKAKPKAKATTKTSSKKKKAAKASVPIDDRPFNKGASKYTSPSAALYDSESKKGMLIQSLLCRWWYAIEWPDKSSLPDKIPKHYDQLNGFEGVYVCTSGDSVGKIMDLRDKNKCPSFANFAKKTSKELKELLLKALEEQKRRLIEAEGEGTATEKEIKDELKRVKKVSVDAADKEAIKVLKAAKMTL